MRIGVDLDGTVYRWDATARYLLRAHRGYPKDGPLGSESDSWHHIEENVAPEDWAWLWSEGVALGLFRHGGIYPGAIDALRSMGEYADLVVITKRPATAKADTEDFLAFHRVPVAELHVLSDYDAPKSTVLPWCDLYVDDAPQIVGDLAANTPGKVALMDRPWNRSVRYAEELWSRRVVRVRSWSEASALARYVKETL